MAGFATAKRSIGFKIEETPYAAETLAATDYNVSAYSVEYEIDIPVKGRDLARANYSRDVGTAGKRAATVRFSVDVMWSGTAATAPNYFKCLRACGLKQTTWGATGVSLVTDSDYSNVPATIEIVERDEGASPLQLVFSVAGCMGNSKIVLGNIGEPARFDFEFKGFLNSITDRVFANQIVPTGFNTTLPDAVLGATTTVFSESLRYNQFTIDLGNDVQLWSDPSKSHGYSGARIADRNPTLEIDPDMALLATNAMYTRHINNTTGSFSWNIGRITVSAPVAQIEQSFKPGDREGHVVNNLRFGLKRSLGNDELEILQGSKT